MLLILFCFNLLPKTAASSRVLKEPTFKRYNVLPAAVFISSISCGYSFKNVCLAESLFHKLCTDLRLDEAIICVYHIPLAKAPGFGFSCATTVSCFAGAISFLSALSAAAALAEFTVSCTLMSISLIFSGIVTFSALLVRTG